MNTVTHNATHKLMVIIGIAGAIVGLIGVITSFAELIHYTEITWNTPTQIEVSNKED